MGFKVEIERKYLVDKDKLPELKGGAHLVQGYLGFEPTVRVRLEEPSASPAVGYITIKGAGLVGRDEFEYTIPADEARQLLKLARASTVAKMRYQLPVEGAPDLKWELDIFEGDNAGLIVAELEMPDENYEFVRPAWLGKDVTEDPAYKNAALAQKPFKTWVQSFN